jgi:hypothetical protein
MRAAANLRTHGFYSKLLPMQPDAALYDEASADASLGSELKLLRAKLGTLLAAGAGEGTVIEVVDAIRRLAAVERGPAAAAAPAHTCGGFTVQFDIATTTRPEDEAIDVSGDSEL